MAAKNLVDSENSTSGAEQLIDYVMKTKKYGDYLKNLMAEVVEDKIGPRLDYCEGQIHDIMIKLDAIETKQTTHDEIAYKVSRIKTELDDLEQYGRRNNLRINGIPEKADENTTELVKTLANDKLGVSLDDRDFDRSHRVGKPGARPRPILVKFTNYTARNLVIKQRRKLKGSRISINEDLTKKNQDLLKKTAQQTGVVSAWSSDGRNFAGVLTSTPGKLAKVQIHSTASWQDLPDEKSYQETLKQLEEKLKIRTDSQTERQTESETREYQTRYRTGSLPK